jgi:hypothetical protein
VTFSFGGMVDQIRRSLGASARRASRAPGPMLPSRLPRAALPPSGGPKASSFLHRVQAVNGGALPAGQPAGWLTSMQPCRVHGSELHLETLVLIVVCCVVQTGRNRRAAAQLQAPWWRSRPSSRVGKVSS